MRDLTPARMFAGAFGIVYLLVGLAGFGVTGFDNWLGTNTGETLLWFELNPLHNVVHIAIGVALLGGSVRPTSARAITWVVGLTYLVVGVIGFWAVGEEWNILSLNHADNWLHVGTAVIALIAVTISENRATRGAERPSADRVG